MSAAKLIVVMPPYFDFSCPGGVVVGGAVVGGVVVGGVVVAGGGVVVASSPQAANTIAVTARQAITIHTILFIS
jgi:non-ribosomal peptide synthetase component E (peptide arylation enzyme)